MRCAGPRPSCRRVGLRPGQSGHQRDRRDACTSNSADPIAIAQLAESQGADLTVIGPEAPLVDGVVDALAERGLAAFGPTAAAARLEGSKAFAKVGDGRGRRADRARARPSRDPHRSRRPGRVRTAVRREVRRARRRQGRHRHHRPRPRGRGRPRGAGQARRPRRHRGVPRRARGFAVLRRRRRRLRSCRSHRRRTSSARTTATRVRTPAGWARTRRCRGRRQTWPTPSSRASRSPPSPRWRAAERPFSGLLYVGLALTSAGPKVIEFNTRFGDPETQAVLARLTSPITELLAGKPATWSSDFAVTVVVAAPGYPDSPQLGGEITGVEAAAAVPGASVQHAGTRREANGRLVASGGRVLAVTGLGADLSAARECAYEAAGHISIAGGQHLRTDIAQKAAR